MRLILFLTVACCLGLAIAQAPTGDGVTDGQVVPVESAISIRIREVFGQIPGLEQVGVSEVAGVVRLSGSVLNAADREVAVRLASQTDGVMHVVDQLHLEIETNVEKTLTPAVQKIRNFLGNAFAFLPLLGIALVIIVFFWILAARVPWEVPYRRVGINPLLSSLIGQLTRTVIFLIGALLALDILGATSIVAALLGTAGLAGLAIGFAFRDIVENYLAGMLMSMRQPFRQNDFIKIGSHEGKVVRLTSRELVLMMPDGNHLRIPNGTVFKSTIHNYSLNPRRRFDFKIPVKVEHDLAYVQELGVETLEAMRGVLGGPGPFSRIGDLNATATQVDIHLYGWIDQRVADFDKVRSQAIRLVKEALSEVGILAEPIPATPATEPVDRAGLEKAHIDALPHVQREAMAIDVSVDTQLDDQIQEDISRSDEENLLEDGSNPGKPEGEPRPSLLPEASS